MELILGAGRLDRRVSDAERLLLAYREDSGTEYLDYRPYTPADALVAEDLAVTTLINSRFGMAAFRSLALHGGEVDLKGLPRVSLEETTDEARDQVARLVATVAGWPGFAASVATKVLHKKRPDLIPILDNQAIFGAYMNSRWPETPSLAESVKALPRIREALDWIAFDLIRPENADAWRALEEREPSRSRIQLFDSVWWMYFRGIEPVHRTRAPEAPMQERPTHVTAPGEDEGSEDENVRVFRDDEAGYRSWLYEHMGGFVVNAARTPTPNYLILHRAACETITPTPDRVWTRDYVKICSTDRYALEAWARSLGGRLTMCEFCDP